MKKTILSLFTAFVLLVTSIIPMGIISVSADNAVVTPEPLASLLKDGKIKIADFSNLTEEKLSEYIMSKDNVDGLNVSINSDTNHTLDGAATSLKWDAPHNIAAKGYYIKTDYKISDFKDFDYSLYLSIKPTVESARMQAFLAALRNKADGSIGFRQANTNSWTVGSTQVNKFRTDLAVKYLNTDNSTLSSNKGFEYIYSNASWKDTAPDSNIYVRMTSVANSVAATYYIDGVWLVLENHTSVLNSPIPSIANESEVNASAFNGYSLTFEKDIAAASDAVTVTKNGVDISSEVTATVSGNTISLTFVNGVDSGSSYEVTVNKAKVRALSGEALDADKTFRFTVLPEKDKIFMSADKLSAFVVPSSGTPTLIAAVYADNTLVSVVTDSQFSVAGRLEVSIGSLSQGQKVKYMLVNNMTSLTPLQSCEQYTKQ